MSDSVQHRPGGDQVGGVLPKQQGQLEVLNVARLLSCVRTMRWLEPPPPPPPQSELVVVEPSQLLSRHHRGHGHHGHHGHCGHCGHGHRHRHQCG